jgi:hypothetical protein
VLNPTEADWEQATRQQRHLAMATDAELHRRHPDQRHPPPCSAEPEPPAQVPSEEPAHTTDEELARTDKMITSLTAHCEQFSLWCEVSGRA